MPREMIHSYVAPRYYPHIGPILVRWEDYEYGSLRLDIGSHAYSKTRATFLRQVVCRNVVGALVLLMNLQLESHANRVNATTDSSMFHIKSSTTNQGILPIRSWGSTRHFVNLLLTSSQCFSSIMPGLSTYPKQSQHLMLARSPRKCMTPSWLTEPSWYTTF